MTTSPPWLQLPGNMPTDRVTYWVNFRRFDSKPFLATWIEEKQEWEIDTLTWRYPWLFTPFFRVQ